MHYFRFATLSLLAIACTMLSSCLDYFEDTPDEIMQDSISLLDECTDVLNGVADGTIKYSDLHGETKDLTKRMDEIEKRFDETIKPLPYRERRELIKKYEKEFKESFTALLDATYRIRLSDKASQRSRNEANAFIQKTFPSSGGMLNFQ